MEARVELKKGKSLTFLMGHKYQAGKGYVITDPAEIRKLDGNPNFSVTMLKGKKEELTVKKEVEESENEEEMMEEDSSIYTKADLKPLKKNELIEIAQTFGIDVEGDETKQQLITSILETQEEG